MPQPDSARAGPGVLIAGLESESADHRAFRRCTRKRAELLAIPAAAAIQNARLYSTAEIYGSELEKRLADLQNAERALDQSEEGRRVSEDKISENLPLQPDCVFDYDARGRPLLGSQRWIRGTLWILPPGGSEGTQRLALST